MNQANGLPLDLVSLFHDGRTLEHYEQRRLIANSNRPIYEATLNGRKVALKEYAVGTDELKVPCRVRSTIVVASCARRLSPSSTLPHQVCYKEAALLRRLRHPSIVELEAIFQNAGHLYLQMPWYENGTLEEWFTATRPSPLALAAVLLQLCQAVAHVHANGVVHSDVKPENVLIDASGRPRLGDFDVSKDATTRRTHR